MGKRMPAARLRPRQDLVSRILRKAKRLMADLLHTYPAPMCCRCGSEWTSAERTEPRGDGVHLVVLRCHRCRRAFFKFERDAPLANRRTGGR